jgi:ribosomal protein S1
MKRIGLFGLVLVLAGMSGACVLNAAEPKATEKEKPADKAAADAARAIPFQGTVVSVDNAGRTFTLNGKIKERLFRITDKSEIHLDNKPATFSSITVGATVRGNAIKHEDAWETKKVSIGPKEAVTAPGEGKK